MQIRPATADDAQAIADIHNDAIEHSTAILRHQTRPLSYWTDGLADRPAMHPAIVAIDRQGRVLGFAMLGAYDDKCGYHDVVELSLYVHPDARGRGVGRQLTKVILDLAWEAGVHSVLSRVTAGNTASIRLHERFGFREVGTFKRLGHKFGQRHNVTLYQLITPTNATKDAP